ncbi:MAG: hypothetical protein AAF449_19335, partial [Myxococcota bacterium]
DGRSIATSDGNGRIRRWSTDTAERVWEQNEPTVWALAFYEQDLLSISSRGRVTRWSKPSKILQPELRARRDSHVDIDVAGRTVAWTGPGSDVVVYDAIEERELTRFSDLATQSSEVALAVDGRLLAGADYDGMLVVWDLKNNVVRWQQPAAHEGIISGLSFSPDGQTLASAGRDGLVRLWDVDNGAMLGLLEGHGDWINTVAFSPDGRWLLSGSDDHTARLWSVESRRPVLRLAAESQVNAVGFMGRQLKMLIGRGAHVVSVPAVVDALSAPAGILLGEAQKSAGLRMAGFDVAPDY